MWWGKRVDVEVKAEEVEVVPTEYSEVDAAVDAAVVEVWKVDIASVEAEVEVVEVGVEEVLSAVDAEVAAPVRVWLTAGRVQTASVGATVTPAAVTFGSMAMGQGTGPGIV